MPISKKINQKDVWNAISDSWTKYKNIQNPFEEVWEFLKDKKGKILDLGCGSGRNFIAFQKETEIYALDFSEKMIENAKDRAKRLKKKAKFFCTGAQKLPFEDNFFDSAIYVATLHCLNSKKRRLDSLKELFRVLKPRKRALITVWSRNHHKIDKFMREQFISWKIDGKKHYRYYYIYKIDELLNDLKKIGFKIINSLEKEKIIIEVEKVKF